MATRPAGDEPARGTSRPSPPPYQSDARVRLGTLMLRWCGGGLHPAAVDPATTTRAERRCRRGAIRRANRALWPLRLRLLGRQLVGRSQLG